MHPCVTVACNAGTQATLLVAVHTRESVSCHVLWTLQGQKGIHQEHFPQADQPAHLDPCQCQEIHLSTFCGHTKPSAGSFGTLLINNNQKTNIPSLQQLLQEPPELANTNTRPLSLLQAAVQAVLQLSHVALLPLCHCLPEVVVAAEDGIFGIPHPPRWH